MQLEREKKRRLIVKLTEALRLNELNKYLKEYEVFKKL